MVFLHINIKISQLFLSSDCKCVNGLCNEGIYGDGRCYCQHGWKGQFCNTCKYHIKYQHIKLWDVISPYVISV